MNKTLFSISIIVTVSLLIVMAAFPGTVSDFVSSSFEVLTQDAGVFYILCACFSLVFVIISFIKYGDVVIGKGNKKYSEFAWGSMMFCTGIGGSMMIFSFVEPLYYLSDSPFGIKPYSGEAFEYAHMYGQFHWGILDWMLCIPLSLFMARLFYSKENRTLQVGRLLFKNKFLADLTDVFCVFAIIGGVATSMGLAAPVIGTMVGGIIGEENTEQFMPMIFIIWFAVYATSVWRGLDKGIKRLSYINVVIALVFIFAVFIIANPLRVIETEINSIGLLADNFFRMSMYTDPFEKAGFPQRWTVFYWALTLAYLPGLAVFTARISEGRTVRELIGGMVLYGSMGTMLSFSTLGYYSLRLQCNGIADVSEVLREEGQSMAILTILQTLPVHEFFVFAFAVLCLIFMATTIDSSVYAIASITMDDKKNEKINPPKYLRMIWAVVMLAFSLFLTRIGGLNTMQTASVITAFPMIIISVIAGWRFLLDMKNAK